jgi:hypothetical protein
VVPTLPRTLCALSRRDDREDGRRGVVGRDRGDLERARRAGSEVGVVDVIVVLEVVSRLGWVLYAEGVMSL